MFGKWSLDFSTKVTCERVSVEASDRVDVLIVLTSLLAPIHLGNESAVGPCVIKHRKSAWVKPSRIPKAIPRTYKGVYAQP